LLKRKGWKRKGVRNLKEGFLTPFFAPESITLTCLLTWLLALAFLLGCAGFQVSADVQQGRRLLVRGQPEQALSKFQRASQLAPDYVTNFTGVPESIWTYLGRAQYDLGQLDEARASLERAVSQNRGDFLGKVYLGLVQMRKGQVSQGLRNAKDGLLGMQAWTRNKENYDFNSQYWDPSGQLTQTTSRLLAEIDARDTPWRKIASDLEWLGTNFEKEIDLSERDEEQDLRMRGGFFRPW